MIDQNLLHYLQECITPERKERFLNILEERTKFITVAIEDVFQRHNMSAVIRSCEVFGIQDAHVIENRNAKCLDEEISMGAQNWVDVHEYKDTASCIDSLRSKGYKIIATTPHNNSCYLDDFELNEKVALFFGTEKNGLTPEVIEKADGYLKVPMVGFTESLNISVSAAIILQSLTNKLKKSSLDWPLTEEEKQEKQLDWTKKSIKSIDSVLDRYLKEH